MGTFLVQIKAVGGHGQDRGKKDGEVVNFYEAGSSTPDAIAKTMVETMRVHGVNVEEANIVHWPGSGSEVTDDLLTGKRFGNFSA